MTTITQKFLQQFILSSLLTTLTAIGMEPAGYPQLQLAELSQKQPKPTITADLYIDPKQFTCYTGSSFRQKLEDVGITSKNSLSQKMPFIPIFMAIDKKDGDYGHAWEDSVPKAIWKHEKKQIEATGRKATIEELFAIEKKKFPHSLPASLLYACTTGSVLHLTVHGYPVVATCRKHPLSNMSFGEQFNDRIDRFKLKSNFVCDMLNYGKDSQELVDAKILTKNLKKHGKNGFVSMEDLLLEDTKKSYGSTHNYLMQRQIGIKPSLRCLQPQEVIETEHSSEDSESSSREDQRPCTIS